MAPASGITVLVVDDNDLDRRLVSKILKQAGYEPAAADSAASARALLHTLRVALVVSDLRMPGESGMCLVEHIRAEYPDVAVLVTSADGAQQTAADLTTIGVHGYLVKPFGIEQFLVGVANALRRHDLEQERNRVEERLEEAVRARTIELTRSREEMVRRLALAVTARDGETGRHSERASHYSWLIATGIGLPPGTCELIRAAAPLHDIGKIAIPDRILRKPGPLTLAERRVIETHTTLGYDILPARERNSSTSPPRSRSATTNGSTEPATRTDSQATVSRSRPESSPSPMCSKR